MDDEDYCRVRVRVRVRVKCIYASLTMTSDNCQVDWPPTVVLGQFKVASNIKQELKTVGMTHQTCKMCGHCTDLGQEQRG